VCGFVVYRQLLDLRGPSANGRRARAATGRAARRARAERHSGPRRATARTRTRGAAASSSGRATGSAATRNAATGSAAERNAAERAPVWCFSGAADCAARQHASAKTGATPTAGGRNPARGRRSGTHTT
jgi:hypothetical protein